jgi:type IV secretion system protein VirD4
VIFTEKNGTQSWAIIPFMSDSQTPKEWYKKPVFIIPAAIIIAYLILPLWVLIIGVVILGLWIIQKNSKDKQRKEEKIFQQPKIKEWYKKPIYIISAAIIIGYFILPSYVTNSIMGLFGALFGLVFWGAIIVWVIWWLRTRKQNKKDKKLKEKLRLEQPDFDLWKKLGSTPEEREKNIKKMFDEKKESLTFGTRWDFVYGKLESDYFIQFRISRNLALMEPREREFLRTTFLLANSGKLNDFQWDYYRFALINGNGKASIAEYNYYLFGDKGADIVRDGPTAIKYYQDSYDASVDSAINNLLKRMETIGQDVSNTKQIKGMNDRIHGSGVWLGEDDINDSLYNGKGNYQLNLGHLQNSDTLLHYSGEGSLITIAPPGSGKTQCFVLPNMLNWKGAALVLDVKGEIYASTHKWRSKNVGQVFKFSPLDPNNSNSYNPLTFIRQDGDYIWEDSRFLADMMIVPSGAPDPFWENMARDVLTAAIAYVSFNNEPSDRPMSKVLDIIYGIGWDEMIIALKTNVFVGAMRQTGHALGEMEKKQRDSVLKTAQSSLSAWQGERIAKVTKKSDWNPLDLRKGSPTIYICINPNEIDSYLSVLRVFIAQHIRMLTTELPPRDVAPVLFMLDELPRLKKMPPVEEALNTGRQYGIKLWMFAQSYGQLKEAYPNPEGLLGSCVVRTFMNVPLNDELATKLSDQLGYRNDALGNTILVLATNTKPTKVQKRFAYEDQELKSRMNL